MKKIAMILHTNGLEYDDRVRKEILTVTKLFPDIQFKIFAIIDGKIGKCESGITDYGIDYEIPYLSSRDKYKPGTHLIAKAWEFYKVVSPKLKDFDAIWCADFRVIFFILLSKKPKVWDMHELPTLFLGNIIKKNILKILISRCNIIIHANYERFQFLLKQKCISYPTRHHVIRNYPNSNDISQSIDETFSNFKIWKGATKCLYIQGINNSSRCDKETIETIMNVENVKAVVVGKFNSDLKEYFKNKYPLFSEKIFFTGMVPQMMTPHYIRQCFASIVFYRNTSPNNYYCEPNRMFQAIMNDCPVIVGDNPPMKELVQKYNFGIAIEHDGCNINENINAVLRLMDNYNLYYENTKQHKDEIMWNQQDSEFKTIINKLLQ